jgi:stage II sporulation protein D
MGRIGHRPWVFGGRAAALAACVCVFWPLACTQHHTTPPPSPGAPIVRVRLLVSQDQVAIRAKATPTVKTASESSALRLNIAPGAQANLVLTSNGWEIGGVPVPGHGELTLWPSEDATVSINDRPYRGKYRFVPTGVTSFDVINDVEIDDYLKGVLSRELLRNWNEETYRAQAITARTYALFEARTRGAGRNWDVNPDERSQVYGGYGDETALSRNAADDTSGIVVAYGEAGHERIFKSYFSACCGGITQSAADAFGESYIPPLSDQDVHGLCDAAPRYNWGPVEITKAELTRRFRVWGARRGNGVRDIKAIAKIDIQSTNRFNRPIRFLITDPDNARYSLTAEELRIAVNAGASKDSPARLNSGFVKVVCEPGADVIRFVEGHGNGHGVGLCQYCSEARAEAGMRHEDIVLSAFPRARLVRAY